MSSIGLAILVNCAITLQSFKKYFLVVYLIFIIYSLLAMDVDTDVDGFRNLPQG